MRIIVAGLYNSGSTCLAGCLYRLGVDMGSPFWKNEANNHYEPYDLACLLRHFWNEPHAREITPLPVRIELLRNWMLGRESLGYSTVGAKHPLLALSLDDIVQAWGINTKILWSYRSLEESIAKLQKRGWFGKKAEPLQQKLWHALQSFCATHQQGILRLDYHQLKTNRARVLDELTEFLEINPTQTQRQEAIEWVLQK